MNDNLIPILIEIMEKKDPETLLHSSRVQRIINSFVPILVAKEIIIPDNIPDLWTSAILHDIGKLFIQDEILESPDKLNNLQYDHIKNHPVRGYNLLNALNIPDNIKLAVRHHHERWDGRNDTAFPGYPDGLSGESIPLYARIISLADTYDALISKRPYKDPISIKEAISIIESNAGTQFDPRLTMLFVESMREEIAIERRPPQHLQNKQSISINN